MLSSKQRAYLKAKATALTDVVIIGKNDVEDSLVECAARALAKRELIKGRLLPSCLMSVQECAAYLGERTGSEVVTTIGSKFVLFKQKKKDSAYDLPR